MIVDLSVDRKGDIFRLVEQGLGATLGIDYSQSFMREHVDHAAAFRVLELLDVDATPVRSAVTEGLGESDDARAQRLRRLQTFDDGQNSTHVVLRDLPEPISHGLGAGFSSEIAGEGSTVCKKGKRSSAGMGGMGVNPRNFRARESRFTILQSEWNVKGARVKGTRHCTADLEGQPAKQICKAVPGTFFSFWERFGE